MMSTTSTAHSLAETSSLPPFVPSVNDSTDTELEPEVEPDGKSEDEKTTKTGDDIQYNWHNQSAVDRKPSPSTGDNGVKLVLEDAVTFRNIWACF
ncbi:hypothetical protein E2C01_044960 [Portunus trituberculatus]|uniref:Uncharacterized protein n=1 Tax=Portunus trituberculatus TaxID=210409 RepID=A0A5B7FUF9_PORTR|nr:hypothetical protein [Portunus trituberculatus]